MGRASRKKGTTRPSSRSCSASRATSRSARRASRPLTASSRPVRRFVVARRLQVALRPRERAVRRCAPRGPVDRPRARARSIPRSAAWALHWRVGRDDRASLDRLGRRPKSQPTSIRGSSAASSMRSLEPCTVTQVSLAADGGISPRARHDSGPELAARSGIPETVIVEKFGLRRKHIAADGEARERPLRSRGRRPLLEEGGASIPSRSTSSCTSARCGRNYALLWQGGRPGSPTGSARPKRVHASSTTTSPAARPRRAGASRARHARRGGGAAARASSLRACRESYLLDYDNTKARFMFNFGDGAVAGLLGGRTAAANALLGCPWDHGRLVLASGEGAVGRGACRRTAGYRFLDVEDPVAMKEGLDPRLTAELRRSGARRRSSAAAPRSPTIGLPLRDST